MDPRVGLEPREREARTAFRESAVRQVPEGSEEGLDVLEVLVLLDPRETLDSLGLPDQWESRVFLDQRAPEDLLERLDCRAFLGRMDPPDRQEREVHLENMDRLDHRETLE